MLPLESSLDVLAEVGAVLETLADGIRGAILVAEQQMDSVALADGWAADVSLVDTIGTAEAKAAAIADAMIAIRQAMYQASQGYAGADQRSARRHGAIAW
jgi:hypothetical protein